MTKDTPLKGGKSAAVREAARKPPLKILNVHSEEFMQIIAKVQLEPEVKPSRVRMCCFTVQTCN